MPFCQLIDSLANPQSSLLDLARRAEDNPWTSQYCMRLGIQSNATVVLEHNKVHRPQIGICPAAAC